MKTVEEQLKIIKKGVELIVSEEVYFIHNFFALY